VKVFIKPAKDNGLLLVQCSQFELPCVIAKAKAAMIKHKAVAHLIIPVPWAIFL